MITKFKVGDIVRLRSGGPSMTVTSFDSMGIVTTAWFELCGEEEGTYNSPQQQQWEGPEFNSFPQDSLIKVSSE